MTSSARQQLCLITCGAEETVQAQLASKDPSWFMALNLGLRYLSATHHSVTVCCLRCTCVPVSNSLGAVGGQRSKHSARPAAVSRSMSKRGPLDAYFKRLPTANKKAKGSLQAAEALEVRHVCTDSTGRGGVRGPANFLHLLSQESPARQQQHRSVKLPAVDQQQTLHVVCIACLLVLRLCPPPA